MMTMMAAWRSGLILLLVSLGLTFAEPAGSSSVCPVNSIKDGVLGKDSVCPLYWNEASISVGVIEVEKNSLQMALNMVHENGYDHVSVLFYASWCPFSENFRPTFSVLSSLYGSIPHFTIEKSIISPRYENLYHLRISDVSDIKRLSIVDDVLYFSRILSKYGVHGFPALFLINSTMRAHFRGSRTLKSLVTFYSNITGLKIASVEGPSIESTCSLTNFENPDNEEAEKEVQQDICLAFASTFVLLRLLHFVLPTLIHYARIAWMQYSTSISLMSFWEHPMTFLNLVTQLINSLREPYKGSNLQEGAISAKSWASKSLASVSFGDANTG